MYNKRLSHRFKKGLKRMEKQGKDISLLENVVDTLAAGEKLDAKYEDHALSGGMYKNCRECHIQPDWLLIYRIDKGELTLVLLCTDSHSNLF